MEKFNKVPVEKDTKILFEQKATLGEYEVLYQKWFWDGITADVLLQSEMEFYLSKVNE